MTEKHEEMEEDLEEQTKEVVGRVGSLKLLKKSVTERFGIGSETQQHMLYSRDTMLTQLGPRIINSTM